MKTRTNAILREKMATINVYITNLHAYAAGELRGEWLALPATEEERRAAWERIGSPEEIFFTDYESEDVPGISQHLDEYESLDQLEELAEALEDMDESERQTLAAVLESGIASSHGAAGLLELCEDVQDGAYTLIEGVDNVENLGWYYAEETGAIDELPDWARGYFDFGAYGRDISIETCGEFVGAGWIEKTA